MVNILVENEELKMTVKVLETGKPLLKSGTAIYSWFIEHYSKLVFLKLGGTSRAICWGNEVVYNGDLLVNYGLIMDRNTSHTLMFTALYGIPYESVELHLRIFSNPEMMAIAN